MTSVMFSVHHIPLLLLLTKLLRDLNTYTSTKCQCRSMTPSPARFSDIIVANTLMCIFLAISHYLLKKGSCFYSVVGAHSF